MSARKPTYTPLPSVPPELMPRLAAIVEVLAGMKTVSQAARELALSRNHFQTLLHRSLLGMVQALTTKKSGRVAQPPALAALTRQMKRLERENARLHKQVASTERLLEVAGGLLQGRIRPTRRQPRRRKSTPSGEAHEDNDRDARRAQLLEAVKQMQSLGLTLQLSAALAGVDVSTLRRWRTRLPGSSARRACRGRIPAEAAAQADALVRQLHGLIGAEALRLSVAGLSRRSAAWLKRRTLTALERERKQALVRVRLTPPGVLRGIDAMHFHTREGALYALIGADGAVPYRTSVTTSPRYDAALVARALERDFAAHGAPLVLRLDRARAHDSPPVRALLEAHGVLALHGPPRYPCFYGQLERQNREHRAWCSYLPLLPQAALASSLEQMREALNALWRRRTLNWRTAAEAWEARRELRVDRVQLHEEVRDRAMSIAHRLKRLAPIDDRVERLAIQQTLEGRGYLRQEIGGWC